MKTATSPQACRANNSTNESRHTRPFAVFAAAAAFTFGIGAAPLIASAQESRTIATGTGIPLAAEAPDRYTVKAGDTLWDIASVFLRDPWYWPEIWYVNPQVKNPHLIYPGDILALVSLDGRPQVQVAERGPAGAAAEADGATGPVRSGGGVRMSPKVRATPITSAVTAIPYSHVAAFMGRPTLLTKSQIRSTPYIFSMRNGSTIGGTDNEVYARGLRRAEEGSRYSMIEVGPELRDPQTDKVLGYRGNFVGVAVVNAVGSVAKLKAEMTEREILAGNLLFPEEIQPALDFIPHPAPENLRGAIASVDGITMGGRRSVIAINRGSKHGLEVGHVMSLVQKGEVVRDKFQNGGKGEFWSMGKKIKLPNERVGLAMIFKTYDRVSYALVMETTHPIHVGDYVGPPN